MDETAAPDTSSELAPLIETNSEILDQIRKDLSQEYTRFMSGLIKERLGIRDDKVAGTSVFAQLDNTAQSKPSAP